MNTAGRTVLLCGGDACLMRMLAFELSRAGFAVAGEGDQPDCALVDLDSADLPDGLPAVAFTRQGREAEGTAVLSRPFPIPTLIDALTRLDQPDHAEPALPGGLLLDDSTHTLSRSGIKLTLMPAEYALLRCLLEAAGEPVSRAALIAAMPSGSTPASNLTEVVICTLRRKLEARFGIRPIRTVRGIGYRYTL